MTTVWAYCAADWVEATEAAGGVKPLASPPLSDEAVDLAKAAAADLVYLNLHGYEGQPYCYGQQGGSIGPTALSTDKICRYDWSGVVVFAEVCFSAKDGGGPIARAFLKGGARAFVGPTTEAYGRIRPTLWDGEADRLMWLFRRLYPKIGDPAKALARAKDMLRLMSYPLDADDKATLNAFVCLEK